MTADPRIDAVVRAVEFYPNQDEHGEPTRVSPIEVRKMIAAADAADAAAGVVRVDTRDPDPAQVERVRVELSRGSYQMPGDALPYESKARAVIAALAPPEGDAS